MTKELGKYDLDILAEEMSAQSPGYTARQAILIGKCLLKLKDSIWTLQDQILKTGQPILSSINRNADNLTKTLDALKQEISNYSKSSDKYANTMKWLTIGLVFFAAVQALGIIVPLFKH